MNLTPASPTTPTGAFIAFGDRLRWLSSAVTSLTRRVQALEAAAALGAVRITNGEPEAALGNDGDVAFDPSTNTLYGPKSAGQWPDSGGR